MRLNDIVSRFKKPEIAAADLNSSATADLHRAQIVAKPFLRRFYNDMYDIFAEQEQAVRSLSGQMLELGSGAGFLKERIPGVITSDVCAMPFVDRVIFAHELPFDPQGLKAIFALNVLHHLSDSEAFFREVDRVLTLGGRVVLIEPHCSAWGKFVYKYLHYEPFDMNAADWRLEDTGRLETANGALPHIIFHRDRARFAQLYPRLKIREIRYHTVLRYLLSGGVSWPALAPTFTYPLFKRVDATLSHLSNTFPIFQSIIIEKTS